MISALALLSLLPLQAQAPEIPRGFPELPRAKHAFPEPYAKDEGFTGFKLRGTKGWGWTKSQYLAELPWVAKGKMTFLMNCYLSYYTDSEKWINNWWQTKPDDVKEDWAQVVQAAKDSGVTFVFAIHPQLSSTRPYDYKRPGDFEALWQHFAFFQGLEVRWFSLSLDDIGTEGTNPEQLADLQCSLVNQILAKLREKDPVAQMIFCPTYYWGDGTELAFQPYWKKLAAVLDHKAYVFWTGPQVVSQTVDLASAKRVRSLMAHRIVLWDNYPVNDRNPALHLGPVTGRDPRLPEVLDGYMSNPMARQNELNRIPMLTCADYAYNPRAYDPWRSIGQAILQVADKPEQAAVLRDLVATYPGGLLCHRPGSAYPPALQCQLDAYVRLASGPNGRSKGATYIGSLERLAAEFNRWFPGAMAAEKETLAGHLTALKAEQARRFP